MKGLSSPLLLAAALYPLLLLPEAGDAKIQIFNPDSLRAEVADPAGLIEAGLANFGHIEYGSSFLGEVFVPKTNVDGCQSFTEDMFDEAAQKAIFHDTIAFELPVVLLERGGCTFVKKVRNVERSGANVALIGDNKVENSEIFIMSDDGSGHSVNIPSFFIRKATADGIMESYVKEERVIIKIEIETGTTGKTADVDLWYSTPFDLSVEQLEGLRDYLPQFDDKIKFLLKLRSKPCVVCSPAEMQRDCLSDGLYCPLMPLSPSNEFKDFFERVPGRDLMMQSLLAKCVHLTHYEYSVNKGEAMRKGLNYMIDFRKNCATSQEKLADFECAKEQMRNLGIDEEIVQSCMEQSFERPGDENSDNELLNDDSMTEIELGIYLHPGVTINNITYKGYLEGEDIHNAVCTVLSPQPATCSNPFKNMVDLSDEVSRTISNAMEEEKKRLRERKLLEQNRVRKSIVWSIFGFIVCAQILFFIWYKKRRQNELSNRMRSSIDSAIVEYMRVGASDDTQQETASAARDAQASGQAQNQKQRQEEVQAVPEFNEADNQ